MADIGGQISGALEGGGSNFCARSYGHSITCDFHWGQFTPIYRGPRFFSLGGVMRFASLAGQLARHEGSPTISISVLRRKLAMRLLAFLSERQVAELLRVTRATVLRWKASESAKQAVDDDLRELCGDDECDTLAEDDLIDDGSDDAADDDQAEQDAASRAEYVREYIEC